ncbi:hypothetical protein [Erythrobacter sp.]|uniref:hypothetical protein n=1 Tax=Erythrobacter sp. TaxID=1042 RepID=UPI002ED03ABF
MLASAGILAAQPVVAQAQFRGLLNDVQRSARSSDTCGEGKKSSRAGRVLGGILGGIGRRTARRAGVPTFVPVAEFTNVLSNEIACLLEPEEQEQAAEATLEATRVPAADEASDDSATPGESGEVSDADTDVVVDEDDESDDGALRGPPVGQTSSWTSRTREGVSGSSTVTAREANASGDGSDCITVTDVVIVEGEETRAEKRMCRFAGNARYTIVA